MKSEYLIGMPHLSFNGLSENWLMKECGDIHWRLLQIPSQNLVDKNGYRIYPSFVTYHFNGNLKAIKEGDFLSINSTINKITEKRLISSHISEYFTLYLVSIFLKKDDTNINFKTSLPTVDLSISKLETDQQILCMDKNLRRNMDNFLVADYVYTYTPVPEMDFNGAQFLYFANYQKIIEIAEWNTLQPFINDIVNFSIQDRKIFYFSNIDVYDKLKVEIHQGTFNSSLLNYTALIHNIDKNKKMAEVHVRKCRK